MAKATLRTVGAGRADPSLSLSSSFSSFVSSAALQLHAVAWQPPGGAALWAQPLHLDVSTGITALVGDNGVGKSLLLRLAEGSVQSGAGSVQRQGRWHAVAQQMAEPAPGTSAAALAGVAEPWQALQRLEHGLGDADDLALADGYWDLAQRWRQAMQAAGLGALQPDDDAVRLSGGQRSRVALAGAWLSGAGGLLLDEPTNHLDREGRRWLLGQLAQRRGAVLLASHDRELLEQVDRIVEVTPQGLRHYGGGWPLFQAQRAAEAQAAQAALRHARAARDSGRRALQQAHDAMLLRSARGRAAGRETNQSPLLLDRKKGQAEASAGRERQRQESAAQRLDEAVRDAASRAPSAAPLALPLPHSAVPPDKPVLELSQMRPPHAAPGQPPLSGVWCGPVRIAITGPNGCGKSTLLRLAAGALQPAAGRWHTRVRAAWLDQHCTQLLPPACSVLQRLEQLGSPLPPAALRTRLAQWGLDAACVQRASGELSGGQRLRAALACALWGGEPAQMLLLDEPTNHLDLRAVQVLEEALAGYGGALMVASHDLRLLAALRPQVVWAWEGGRWNLDAQPGEVLGGDGREAGAR